MGAAVSFGIAFLVTAFVMIPIVMGYVGAEKDHDEKAKKGYLIGMIVDAVLIVAMAGAGIYYARKCKQNKSFSLLFSKIKHAGLVGWRHLGRKPYEYGELVDFECVDAELELVSDADQHRPTTHLERSDHQRQRQVPGQI